MDLKKNLNDLHNYEFKNLHLYLILKVTSIFKFKNLHRYYEIKRNILILIKWRLYDLQSKSTRENIFVWKHNKNIQCKYSFLLTNKKN